ncbi:MAG: ATP-dependent endonuclease [Bacteroidales bacterium]|nr:ATP-dependent endonuclease [Bacteroidales bacterium]
MVENLKFVPTPCQENLFRELAQFVAGDPESDWLMLLSGYAGTGKTSAMSAFIKVLKSFGKKYILLAPTGRSAKVLANYTGAPAKTIHKQIYRQKSLKDGIGQFSIDLNKNRDTVFIVDEASLITIGNTTGGSSFFGTGDLLDDLITYVKSNNGNRLLLIGDPAQLPPIGMDASPALDPYYLTEYGGVRECWLRSVVRQEKESGILHNATLLRNLIESEDFDLPQLSVEGFEDIKRITGGELIESISDAIDKYGLDEVVVLCRSNKRANRYNLGIRQSVLYKEEQLTKGDKLMIVKNCYQFLENVPELDFIANGDVACLERIGGHEERYGLKFATATLSFADYNNVEIDAKIILDTLTSETPALNSEQQKMLFNEVYADYDNITAKKKRIEAVREDPYFNALQIKYATAITGHKSQGGQWKCVFIDNPFWSEEMTPDDKKWLYTAITRGIEQVYLVNFKDNLFKQ